MAGDPMVKHGIHVPRMLGGEMLKVSTSPIQILYAMNMRGVET